jgi:hypothetical protein
MVGLHHSHIKTAAWIVAELEKVAASRKAIGEATKPTGAGVRLASGFYVEASALVYKEMLALTKRGLDLHEAELRRRAAQINLVLEK